ncbi:hypothetical protein M427DRAFT_29376 [Gonapodya prolifera JEL478]|uniref:Uncharacterized protein n=1 Tax=Gonapodya prolifera (strain JEL478) TaxID=1344416 RepID=A0A139AQA8_GONPJ|nr:hypothetical protein M427DRAFT_29376 [Gonapodya prolifera JEL478]|eukprot:KXS18929.1 hypothetical protein M427DRAFT_29376 [Gonapodya prolifera JEL478]
MPSTPTDSSKGDSSRLAALALAMAGLEPSPIDFVFSGDEVSDLEIATARGSGWLQTPMPGRVRDVFGMEDTNDRGDACADEEEEDDGEWDVEVGLADNSGGALDDFEGITLFRGGLLGAFMASGGLASPLARRGPVGLGPAKLTKVPAPSPAARVPIGPLAPRARVDPNVVVKTEGEKGEKRAVKGVAKDRDVGLNPTPAATPGRITGAPGKTLVSRPDVTPRPHATLRAAPIKTPTPASFTGLKTPTTSHHPTKPPSTSSIPLSAHKIPAAAARPTVPRPTPTPSRNPVQKGVTPTPSRTVFSSHIPVRTAALQTPRTPLAPIRTPARDVAAPRAPTPTSTPADDGTPKAPRRAEGGNGDVIMRDAQCVARERDHGAVTALPPPPTVAEAFERSMRADRVEDPASLLPFDSDPLTEPVGEEGNGVADLKVEGPVEAPVQEVVQEMEEEQKQKQKQELKQEQEQEQEQEQDADVMEEYGASWVDVEMDESDDASVLDVQETPVTSVSFPSPILPSLSETPTVCEPTTLPVAPTVTEPVPIPTVRSNPVPTSLTIQPSRPLLATSPARPPTSIISFTARSPGPGTPGRVIVGIARSHGGMVPRSPGAVAAFARRTSVELSSPGRKKSPLRRTLRAGRGRLVGGGVGVGGVGATGVGAGMGLSARVAAAVAAGMGVGLGQGKAQAAQKGGRGGRKVGTDERIEQAKANGRRNARTRRTYLKHVHEIDAPPPESPDRIKQEVWAGLRERPPPPSWSRVEERKGKVVWCEPVGITVAGGELGSGGRSRYRKVEGRPVGTEDAREVKGILSSKPPKEPFVAAEPELPVVIQVVKYLQKREEAAPVQEVAKKGQSGGKRASGGGQSADADGAPGVGVVGGKKRSKGGMGGAPGRVARGR